MNVINTTKFNVLQGNSAFLVDFIRVGLLTLFLILFLPLTPNSQHIRNIGDLDVDVSFSMAMPVLHNMQAQFGRDVIFTYGPLGYLLSNHLSKEYLWQASFIKLFFAIIFWITASQLTRGLNSKINSAVLIPVLFFISLLVSFGWDQVFWGAFCFFTSVLYFFFNNKSPIYNKLIIALTICSALCSLIKFNFFIIASVNFMVICIFGTIKDKKIPFISILFFALLLFFWELTGQALEFLLLWIKESYDLSLGYTDAMSKGFLYPYKIIDIVFFTFSSLVICSLTILFILRHIHDALFKSGFLIIVTFLLFVTSKHAWGGNQVEQSAIVLLLIFYVYSILILRMEVNYQLKIIPFVFIFLGLLADIALLERNNFSIQNTLKHTLPKLVENTQEIKDILLGSPSVSEKSDIFSDIRNTLPIPSTLTGTADIYPSKIGIILANPNLTYKPRPAYLSLNAHTEILANLNALHLRAQDAPEFVIFEILPDEEKINNRYPSMSDGPSWVELLNRYDLQEQIENFSILKRLKRPRAHDLITLQKVDIKWNQVIDVPSTPNKLIWLKVAIDKSLFGKVVNFFYKSPHISMTVELQNGDQISYQIIPSLGKAGFLLSPEVTRTDDFVQILKSQKTGLFEFGEKVVSKVKFEVEGGYQNQYNDTIKLEFLNLD